MNIRSERDLTSDPDQDADDVMSASSTAHCQRVIGLKIKSLRIFFREKRNIVFPCDCINDRKGCHKDLLFWEGLLYCV